MNLELIAVRLARFILRRPLAVIAGAAIAFVLTAAGAARLGTDDDYRQFFHKKDPHLLQFEAFEDNYAKEDSMLFAVAPKKRDVFNASTLDAIERLTEEAWQIPNAVRVDSLTNYQHVSADGDGIVVEDLVENAPELTSQDLERIRNIALHEPLIVSRVVSPDGAVAGVYVKLQLPGKGPGEQMPGVHHARALADRFKKQYPDLDIYMTGTTIFASAFTEFTKRDLATLVPIMYAVIVLSAFVLLRSFTATFAVLTIVVLSMGSTLGITGWLGIPITPPSGPLPTIVMMIAIADSIHLLVTLIEEMHAGRDKNTAIQESLRLNFNPVLVTSLTTAIGFLTMNLSGVPPLEDLGNMVAIGAMVALGYSVLLLPALLAVLPVHAYGSGPRRRGGLHRMSEFVIGNGKQILVGSGALIAIAVFLIPRNQFVNNFGSWFDESTEVHKHVTFIEDNLTGSQGLEYSIPAADSYGISDPEYLETLDAFVQWLRSQPEVIYVASFADVIKRLNASMHGDDDSFYRIPPSAELIAQYILLYEMSLPYGQDLNNQIDVDKSATRLTILTPFQSNVEQSRLQARAGAWLQEHAPDYMHASATGATVLINSMVGTTIRSTARGLPTALFFVSIVLIAAFRSLKFGLLSLIPNLVPIVLAFGAWGILVGRFNFGIACVAGMAVGIVVDDTVHFISKYLRARREKGLAPEDAVRDAFSAVGRAMFITTFVLLAGFAVLTFSQFQFNTYMGGLTALVVAFAFLADILLLPAILIRFDKGAIAHRRFEEIQPDKGAETAQA